MTAADFEAVGLYDPAAPNAADRLALLEWLAERGATIPAMVEAGRAGRLSGLAGDLALRPGPRFSATELAAHTGLPVDEVIAVTVALGLPPPAPDARVYTEDELHIFRTFVASTRMFGEAPTRRFSRVIGSAMARVAEAAVTLFQTSVEGPLRESGGSELALAQVNLRAIEGLEGVRMLLRAVFTAHMETAIRRMREARPRPSFHSARLAVGFVDLVGFTSLAHRVSPTELADVIARFEDAAYDVAASRDGRVVKLVGDEVMFVTRDAGAACDIALTLFERFAGDAAVLPRGGLAYGDLLLGGGDYYGAVVNLAARVAQIAVPNELLVTPELAAAAGTAALRFDPAGKRMLKGFDDPVALLSVARG